MFVAMMQEYLNPLKAKLNPICHLLALLGAHSIFHVSRIRVKVSDSGVTTVKGCKSGLNLQ
jgi:hypothetical protein